MSDKSHKIVALVGGVLFAVAAGLLQVHFGPTADKAFEGAMSVLGLLGFGVTRPLVSAQTPAPVISIADARTKDQE